MESTGIEHLNNISFMGILLSDFAGNLDVSRDHFLHN